MALMVPWAGLLGGARVEMEGVFGIEVGLVVEVLAHAVVGIGVVAEVEVGLGAALLGTEPPALALFEPLGMSLTLLVQVARDDTEIAGSCVDDTSPFALETGVDFEVEVAVWVLEAPMLAELPALVDEFPPTTAAVALVRSAMSAPLELESGLVAVVHAPPAVSPGPVPHLSSTALPTVFVTSRPLWVLTLMYFVTSGNYVALHMLSPVGLDVHWRRCLYLILVGPKNL